MSVYRTVILFLFVFTSSVSALDRGQFNDDTQKIQHSIASHGSSIVIVGLSDPITAKSMSAASIKTQKTTFLRSGSVVRALINKSMQVVDELENLPFVIVKVNMKGFQSLQSNSQVKTIEADRELKASLKTAVPKIAGFSNPWGSSTYNGQGSWVAVIDSGVFTNHTMFQGKSIIQACFTTDASCPNNANTQYGGNAANPVPKGKSDHGTHVAGIAVGRYVPSQLMGGVAHKANLIAIQVFDRDASAYTSSLIRALNYVYSLAASRRVAAANMSLGGGLYDTSCDSLSSSVSTAIRKLRDRKVATVVASGNNGSDLRISFPACIREAIAVASATKSYGMSAFSNRNTMISLIAPGSTIKSATIGTGYSVKSGTSMATPMIAGAFASMRRIKPTATVSAIEGALQNASRLVRDTLVIGDQYFHFWPLLNKARTNIGGTTQSSTAVGFNTGSSVSRFNKASNKSWFVNNGTLLGANGVAYNFGSADDWSNLVYPQTILTGRISAKIRSTNATNKAFGLLVRHGGSVEYDSTLGATSNTHDGYGLYITNNGSYSVWKHRHGTVTNIIPWTNDNTIVKANDWNILLATTGGKSVKFYVNGKFIGGHTDSRLVYGAPGIRFFDNSGTFYSDWFVTKSNDISVGYRELTDDKNVSMTVSDESSGSIQKLYFTGCPESPDSQVCAAIDYKRKIKSQVLPKK